MNIVNATAEQVVRSLHKPLHGQRGDTCSCRCDGEHVSWPNSGKNTTGVLKRQIAPECHSTLMPRPAWQAPTTSSTQRSQRRNCNTERAQVIASCCASSHSDVIDRRAKSDKCHPKYGLCHVSDELARTSFNQLPDAEFGCTAGTVDSPWQRADIQCVETPPAAAETCGDVDVAPQCHTSVSDHTSYSTTSSSSSGLTNGADCNDVSGSGRHAPPIQHTTESLYSHQEAPPQWDFPSFLKIDLPKQQTRLAAAIASNASLAKKIACVPRLISGERLAYVVDAASCPVTLGEGAYGVVLLGRFMPTGLLVAIKLFKRQSGDLFEGTMLEAGLLHALSDSGVTPRMHGVALTTRSTRFLPHAIIMEFVGDARTGRVLSLHGLIGAARGSTLLPRRRWLTLFIRIVRAVCRIHAMGIILNDIKQDNVLIRPCSAGGGDDEDDGLTPVIIDVGISLYHTNEVTIAAALPADRRELFLRKYFHIPPENVYRQFGDERSDVYQIGIMYRKAAERLAISDLYDVGDLCVHTDPRCRPSTADLIRMLEAIRDEPSSARAH